MKCSSHQDLCVIRGDSFFYLFEYEYPNGDGVAMTTAKLDVKDRLDDAVPIFTLTESDGLELLDGEILVTISPERTALLTWTGAVYDLEIDGDTTIVSGRVIVQVDVTT